MTDRGSRWLACALCLVACEGPAGADDASASDSSAVDASSTTDPVELGVYAEFIPYADVQTMLPSLVTRGAALQLAIPADRIGDASLADLLREAETRGVGVRLWLLLARDAGYWPNEDNLAQFGDEVTRLLDWVEAEGLRADAVVYDLEPALAYTERLREAFASGSLAGIEALMRTHLDPVEFAASRDLLAAQVRGVQARGYRAEAVTYPQVVDDMADGDPDLQDALDIPIDGVPFDDVAFMVYQTSFAEAQGEWIGPGLVRSYAADATLHFGARATLALGIIGTAGVIENDGPPYPSPADLAADVGAARAAGIERLVVYSLDGMAELADLEGWLAATAAAPASVAITTAARIVRAAAAGLDAALDAPP